MLHRCRANLEDAQIAEVEEEAMESAEREINARSPPNDCTNCWSQSRAEYRGPNETSNH